MFNPGDKLLVYMGEGSDGAVYVQAIFKSYLPNDGALVTIQSHAGCYSWPRANGTDMGVGVIDCAICPDEKWLPPAPPPELAPLPSPPETLSHFVELADSTLDILRASGYTPYGVYRNEDFWSSGFGNIICLAFGQGATLAEPPKTAPDGPYGAGHRYHHIGSLDPKSIETLGSVSDDCGTWFTVRLLPVEWRPSC